MKVNWSDDFKSLYKQRGQQKYGIRLLALWKIQSGINETDVCGIIGKTHKTIREWRKSYEEGGLSALLTIAPGRGKKPKVDLSKTLADDIKFLQDERDGGRIRCKDILDLVESKHGVRYSQSAMYTILHKLGFSWITSRSKHPKSDPEAMEAFKKTSKFSSRKPSRKTSA